VKRSVGQRSAAQEKKSVSSSSWAVCCVVPKTSHGFVGWCSVTLKLMTRTNVCSQMLTSKRLLVYTAVLERTDQAELVQALDSLSEATRLLAEQLRAG
jgi:hypothetical protein